jgi:ribonuclease HI
LIVAANGETSTEPLAVDIVFDGGSIRNPGDGYGSYCLQVGHEQPRIGRLVFGRASNNEAEYLALIGGLEDALRSIEAGGRDPAEARLTVHGDSQLVLQQVQGLWKVKAAHLRALRDRAAALVARFGTAELRWHPRAESVRILGH